jgi:putative DNA primase/helicase
LRVFCDRKNTAFKELKLECSAGDILSMVEKLRQHNKQNRGVYFVVNHGGHEGGDKAIHALSKPCQKYSYTETEEKIRHFYDSGTKPMTCLKIAELGYKCHRFDNGGCECKSPAALCYKPFTADELLKVLDSLKVPDTAIEKAQAVKAYIMDYLYNIEPVIAETILNHNVK